MTEIKLKAQLSKIGLPKNEITKIINKCCDLKCNLKCVNRELQSMGYDNIISIKNIENNFYDR